MPGMKARRTICLLREAMDSWLFIKPSNYEISKTRKYRNNIGKLENMEYDEEGRLFTPAETESKTDM